MTLLNPEFWTYIGVIVGIYGIFGLGLQLQLGYAGLLNLGHVAFMAIGAYGMAITTVKLGFPLWASCLAGIAAATVFGLAVGLTSARLTANFFAISAFALAQIVQYVAANTPALTGGTVGTVALAGNGKLANYNTDWISLRGDLTDWLTSVTGLEWDANGTTLLVVCVVAAVLTGVLQILVHTPWGRALRAIRDDPDAAAALGKNVLAYRLQVLAIGSAVGGVAGILYAFQLGFFAPSDFAPTTTLIAFTVVILGGTARNWTVMVGALAYGLLYGVTRFISFPPLSYLDSAQLAYLRLIIIGALMIGLMAFRPQGIFGKREELSLD